MTHLIIDAANKTIFLKIIKNGKSYTTEFINSRENFDKFSLIIFEFLKKNNIKIEEISNILINQGPGVFSGIRSSISTVKALSLSNNINIYGFNSNQVEKKNYNKVLDLFKKGALIKNIIKPHY